MRGRVFLFPPKYSQLNGWGAALTTVTLFSLVPALTRLVIQAGVSPLEILLIRLVVAALLLGMHWTVQRTPGPQFSRRAMLATLAVGLINAGGELALFAALQTVDAALATLLLATIPLVVLALLAGRGERLTGLIWLRLVIGLVGAVVMVGAPTGAGSGYGVALLVGAVLLFGVQYAVTQWYLINLSAVAVALFGTLAAFPPVALANVFISTFAWPPLSVTAWLALAVLVVGATYIARVSFLAVVSRLGSAELALLLPMEMFAGLLWAVWLLGESLTGWHALGGGLAALSAGIGVYAARHGARAQLPNTERKMTLQGELIVHFDNGKVMSWRIVESDYFERLLADILMTGGKQAVLRLVAIDDGREVLIFRDRVAAIEFRSIHVDLASPGEAPFVALDAWERELTSGGF